MTGPRWLDERQQRAWRAWLALQTRLQAGANRALQAEAGTALGAFDVLVALTDRPGVPLRVFELAEAAEVGEEPPVPPFGPDGTSRAGRAPGLLVFDGLDPNQVDTLADIAEGVLNRIDT